MIRIFDGSSSPIVFKLYPFNITLIENNLPVFNEIWTEVVINKNFNTTIVFPLATDSDGDAIYYKFSQSITYAYVELQDSGPTTYEFLNVTVNGNFSSTMRA